MSDIVERLRSPEFADVAAKYLMAEAADELDRLRKERSALLEALELVLAWTAQPIQSEHASSLLNARTIIAKAKGTE